MIHEVDDALRSLVRGEALGGTQVSVVFDAPNREWAAKVNAPTVNMYLYDIREDLRRRSRGLANEYGERGTVVARHRPPRYFKLSYLITAWTRRPEDEHRLLSSLLLCLLRHDAVPRAHLTGLLAELPLTVPMTIALPPPEDRSFADVWSALGGELKPSLDLVVSVPLVGAGTFAVGPPVTEDGGLRLGMEGIDRAADTAASSSADAASANGAGGGAGPGNGHGGRRGPGGAEGEDGPGRRPRPGMSRRIREP
ncbi:DUF4255 domain-containing protein [Streptomyces sp. GMY02]|uniref:DUF4255 domain-containing protein n=1 Tax=Streptomyces sp. GMY02 TaxID=1333528 RepID=UPI001C2C0894|nr:DUF4255 domain-containing protein [Streptomyces sp. GMY02]QXE33811.1 DUF4255 domain-containing protein [Streptomyces sp. GMY02]